MADRTRNYWLHRITGGENALPVAWQLLHRKVADERYLSIGWSDFSEDSFANDVRQRGIDAINERYNKDEWEFSRNRWSLWRFIHKMRKGDYVIVPSWGTFSVFEIIDDIVLSNESYSQIDFEDWSGNVIEYDGKYLRDTNNNEIDLGFYRRVKVVVEDIERSKYADADLISRMKIRQTNADINDLWESVENAIIAYDAKKPINLKENILSDIIENTFVQIKKTLDADKFEKLVEWYLESLGATWTTTPAKNGSKTEEGDVDKVAYFEKLKLIVMVQAKRHEDITGDWAVQQITAYKDNNKPSDDYSTIMWVISTCDQYSDKAIRQAQDNGVRLINGREFTQMILENGLNGMDL